jgi:hypothetical protein
MYIGRNLRMFLRYLSLLHQGRRVSWVGKWGYYYRDRGGGRKQAVRGADGDGGPQKDGA